MRRLAIVALLGATPLGAEAQIAGVEVEESVRYYTLPDRSLGQVIDRLNETRLEGGDAPRSQGLTQWHIRPEWRPEAVGGGRCRVGRLALNVRIVITLPEWGGVASAPAEERMRWARILAAIREHEEGHRDLTIEGAEELHGRLVALETSGCRALRRSVSGEMSMAEQRIGEAHAELDRSTPSRLPGQA